MEQKELVKLPAALDLSQIMASIEAHRTASQDSAAILKEDIDAWREKYPLRPDVIKLIAKLRRLDPLDLDAFLSQFDHCVDTLALRSQRSLFEYTDTDKVGVSSNDVTDMFGEDEDQ
jgi:hypothetical protein